MCKSLCFLSQCLPILITRPVVHVVLVQFCQKVQRYVHKLPAIIPVSLTGGDFAHMAEYPASPIFMNSENRWQARVPSLYNQACRPSVPQPTTFTTSSSSSQTTLHNRVLAESAVDFSPAWTEAALLPCSLAFPWQLLHACLNASVCLMLLNYLFASLKDVCCFCKPAVWKQTQSLLFCTFLQLVIMSGLSFSS